MDRLIEMSQEYDNEFTQMLSEEDLQLLDIPDSLPTTRINSNHSQDISPSACSENSVDVIEPDLSGGGLLVAKASYDALPFRMTPFAVPAISTLRTINSTEY